VFGREPPMRIARRFLISGRVQGVGFRYFTQDVATREGVTGFVRNTPDGNVEALVEGDQEAVIRVERAIRMGPGGARVESVHVSTEEPSGAYKAFNVTRTR
jgi:acylphosphatase